VVNRCRRLTGLATGSRDAAAALRQFSGQRLIDDATLLVARCTESTRGARLELHINPGDELPIYRQIMRQIIDAVAGGRLQAGAQTPFPPGTGGALVIAPLTVKRLTTNWSGRG